MPGAKTSFKNVFKNIIKDKKQNMTTHIIIGRVIYDEHSVSLFDE